MKTMVLIISFLFLIAVITWFNNMRFTIDGTTGTTLFGVLLILSWLQPYMEPLFLFTLGCVSLYYCCNALIDASILLSQKLKLSPIIIGATIIAIGTSLPELLVSLYSTFFIEDPDVASSIIIGNVLGSNIANVALVLGFCAFVYKIIFESEILKDLLFIFSLGLYAIICLYYEINITYEHGIILLFLFLCYLCYLVINNKIDESEDNDVSPNILFALFVTLISIIGLGIGTDLVVKNAINISTLLGFKELTIGLTIIALGTSLPELFTSIAAIKKKKYSLLIGNIIGSNVINIIFVLGFSALLRDGGISISNDNISPFIPYIAIAFIVSSFSMIHR